jgi:hypothetical protein
MANCNILKCILLYIARVWTVYKYMAILSSCDSMGFSVLVEEIGYQPWEHEFENCKDIFFFVIQVFSRRLAGFWGVERLWLMNYKAGLVQKILLK